VLCTHKAAYKIPRLFFLTHTRRAPGSFKDFRSKYAAYVSEYYFVDFQLHQHEYDYLDYLPRLVSTRKLVEDGSREINN
jgi:hypothetical protein